MRGMFLAVLATISVAVVSCGDEGGPDFSRNVVDCSADDAICDDVPDTGCALDLLEVDEDGQVVGTCGAVVERRMCTKQCELDENCPEGWRCLTADRCPVTTAIRYCVPSGSELQLQGVESCRADADPRVCGFF